VINAGSPVGNSAVGVSLKPVWVYQHLAYSAARPLLGAIDIGAYEAQ
jgi:hypothetical protein